MKDTELVSNGRFLILLNLAKTIIIPITPPEVQNPIKAYEALESPNKFLYTIPCKTLYKNPVKPHETQKYSTQKL